MYLCRGSELAFIVGELRFQDPKSLTRTIVYLDTCEHIRAWYLRIWKGRPRLLLSDPDILCF